MEALTLFAICCVGTLVPLLNPEVSAVLYGKELGWNPALVGLVGAAGQSATYLFLYLLGGRILPRFRGLAALVERTRLRYHTHLARRFGLVAALAGTVGIPPASAVSALAPGFGIGVRFVLPLLFVGRALRLGLLAAFGDGLNLFWGPWL